MRSRPVALAALTLCGLVVGCFAGQAPPEPAGAFRPEAFFRGAAQSRGTVRTALFWREPFTADFSGRVQDGRLTLDERFHFAADRNPLQRWRLEFDGSGGYRGTVQTDGADGRLHAPVPVKVRAIPAGIELSYDGFAPGGDTPLHFRHRMVMQGDGTVRNLVRISRFGVPVAGADVVFRRAGQDDGAKLR